jgi:hypothetical protein
VAPPLAAQSPVSGAGNGPEVAPTEDSGLPGPAPSSSGSGGAMAESSALLRAHGDYEELALIGNGNPSKNSLRYCAVHPVYGSCVAPMKAVGVDLQRPSQLFVTQDRALHN